MAVSRRSSSVAAWDLVFALPNLFPPDRSFETSTLLVPSPDDDRFVALVERDPRTRKFLASFVDEHGRESDCAAMLSYPSRPPLEPVYAFRDALALSTVVAEVARHLNYRSSMIGLLFSDYFRFHPTTLAFTDVEAVITQSPALKGLEELDDFVGQVNPRLPVKRLSNIDDALLKRLLRLWHHRFNNGRRNARLSRAVFRSLNMAFEAAALTHNDLPFDRDLGIRLSQWVAAFEILIWPVKKRASFEAVEAQLLKRPWTHRKCIAAKYPIWRSGKLKMVTLPVYVYYLMYGARNDYLHGNPIARRLMFPFSSGDSLLTFAPLLFRVLLDTLLPIASRQNTEERTRAEEARFDIERAIAVAAQ